MALAEFVPESRPVLVNGKALFNVEGLSLDTLAILVRTHLPDFDAVFGIITAGEHASESFVLHLQRISQAMMLQCPGLVANIIAVASGEELTEELITTARRLPFPIQVDALMQIGSLTFEEAGGVKKAAESLMFLLTRLRTKPLQKEADQPTPTSSASTTESAET